MTQHRSLTSLNLKCIVIYFYSNKNLYILFIFKLNVILSLFTLNFNFIQKHFNVQVYFFYKVPFYSLPDVLWDNIFNLKLPRFKKPAGFLIYQFDCINKISDCTIYSGAIPPGTMYYVKESEHTQNKYANCEITYFMSLTHNCIHFLQSWVIWPYK